MAEVAFVRCEAVRWLADDPQPGWIEVALLDAAGRIWRFHDKPPIFESDPVVTKTSPFPLAVRIRVRVVAGGDPITVSTDPDGVKSVEGESVFQVPLSSVQR